MKKALLVSAAGIAVIAMIICSRALILETVRSTTTICSPLPEGFSEEELVGTWRAGVPAHSDTLIIRADGTYKQIVHVEFVDPPGQLDYESDWQPWHLEYSEENIAYLHLDGMRFCGMNAGIPCEERVGGGYDFCRDESIKMLNAGILLVLSTKDAQLPAREVVQYHLRLHYPLGGENTWVYKLQEP